VTGTFVYTPAAATVLNAGSQTLSVTFTPKDATDCSNASTTVKLTVNPAVLTVTANNASRQFGAANPAFTDKVTGFVNGDTAATAYSGAPANSTTATATSPVGTYPITPSLGTLTSSNYTFKYVNGTLTVTKGPSAIAWPTPAAIPYGTPLSSTQLDAAATCGGISVAGTYVYTPALGAVLSAGSQTLKVTFTPNDTSSCAVTTATVTLKVNPAVLTVTALDAGMQLGGPLPAFLDTITGFVNGDSPSLVTGKPSLTTTATANSPVGTYPITAALGTLKANGNYTFVFIPGTLTVTTDLLPVTAEISCWNSNFAYGYNYTCDANMDSGSTKGYMTYSYDGGPLVILPLNASGHAPLFTITLPTVGTHTVVVNYPQQGTYKAYALPVQTFTVTPAPVIVAITPSTFYTTVNNGISFATKVNSSSAGSPNATGSVSFYDGSKLLGTVAVNATGNANLPAQILNLGYHTITAKYSGGTNYGTGSTSITVQIGQY
jgi:hypothetical protein